MSIGIVGKPDGVRWITGGVNYGKIRFGSSNSDLEQSHREEHNLRNAGNKYKGRSILLIGRAAIKITRIDPPKASPKRTRKS